MTEPADHELRTIDEILAALSSPARAEELKGEAILVEAMAAAVIADHPQEIALMASRSRPLKIGLLAGAAVLSLAGVAAAATGVIPSRRPVEPPAATVAVDPASTATSTTVQGTTTTALETTSTEAADDAATVAETPTTPTTAAPGAPTLSIPPCPADVTNHGQYVSSVARDTPPGPDHGKVVSAAAQSDCGKAAGEDTGTTASASPEEDGHASEASHGNQGSQGNQGSHGKQGSNGSSGNSAGNGRGRGH